MVHRYLAGAFVFLIVPLVLAAWRNRAAVRWAGAVAVALGVLYAVQVLVGALNVWYTFPDPLTISHTVIATLIWFTLAGAVALSFYGPAVAVQPSPLKKAGAAA
jgi:heme A synthase